MAAAQGSSARAKILVALNPPPEGDVVFVSVDAAGSPGQLNMSVLRRFGLPEEAIPKFDELSRGFARLSNPKGGVIYFIVTVNDHDSDPREALQHNLAACLKQHGPLKGKRVWLPLMATGAGRLTNEESLRAILSALDEGLALEARGAQITIAAPEGTTPSQLSRLRRIVQGPPKRSAADQGTGENYSDVARMQDDRPTRDDLLGRRPIARSLAERIDRMAGWGRTEDRNSIMIQLHAPWGAGKTSFVEMLSEELTSLNPHWTVVTFNAWENQRIDPPWWMLYETISRSLLPSKPIARRVIRAKELLWRLTVGNSSNLILIVLGCLALVAVIILGRLTEFDTTAKAVTAIGALLATAAAVIRTASNGLIGGGSKSAQNFVEMAQDPVRKLRRHYERILESPERRVLVFIDDLDRCMPKYLVALLEGVQTMFAHPRVVWLVAADRRWIAEAFEEGYPMAKSVAEAGNRLGYQFLEKAFQLMIALPRISQQYQTEYWRHILDSRDETDPGSTTTLEARYEVARNQIDAQTSEGLILGVVRENADLGPALVERLRRDAVARMAAPDIEQSVEHLLTYFSSVIKPNPRAMKRLVNSYAIFRDVTLVSSLSIWDRTDLSVLQQRVQLARWVILCMDAPLLLDAIERDPDLLKDKRAKVPKDLDPALRSLWLDPRIQALLHGFNERDLSVNALDPQFVREFAPLRG